MGQGGKGKRGQGHCDKGVNHQHGNKRKYRIVMQGEKKTERQRGGEMKQSNKRD